MTLAMRDRENRELGRVEGIGQMVANALTTTKSVKQTAMILRLDEQIVKNIAEEKGISVNDIVDA